MDGSDEEKLGRIRQILELRPIQLSERLFCQQPCPDRGDQADCRNNKGNKHASLREGAFRTSSRTSTVENGRLGQLRDPLHCWGGIFTARLLIVGLLTVGLLPV